MTELDPWVYVYDVVEGDRVVFHIVPKSKIDDVEYRVNGGAAFSVWVHPDTWFDRLFRYKFDDRLRTAIEYMEFEVARMNGAGEGMSRETRTEILKNKIEHMVCGVQCGFRKGDY